MARLPGRLTARQVDVVLEVLVLIVVGTGILSLAIGTSWAGVVTATHAIAAFGVVVLAPAKFSGSVRTGLRRRRLTRWLSVFLASVLLLTIVLGFLHSTGLWYGVGEWTALWTHVLVAFLVLAVFLWHLASRPSRPGLADLDRRAVLRGGAVLAVAGVAYAAQEGALRVLGLEGERRRFTGSHEIGSHDPARLPVVSWINDRTPASTHESGWTLVVDGRTLPIERLHGMTRQVTASIDCTGGWWSEHHWDAVPLSALLPDRPSRSVTITSSTGYSRMFPRADADRIHLAIGYGGQPLQPGHGAPVRVVAPGRRGPWWVKWVTSVELSNRPWWLQLPFPIE